jgi:toxin ParE1/3/4
VTRKRVVPLEAAVEDINKIADYYTDMSGKMLARRFANVLKASFRRISSYPGVGSLRYEAVLGLDGLRVWQLRGFPYLVFYVEGSDEIEVWRVLHAERDLMAELGEDNPT